MALDEKSEEWFREYTGKYPWVKNMIGKFGIDLSLYDLNTETSQASEIGVNRSNFMEDVHFLKALDEYVQPRLPADFSTVLEVGVGCWTYAYAMAAFFRRHNDKAIIKGIDVDPSAIKYALDSLKNRNVLGVAAIEQSITEVEGSYDILVNICPNLQGNDWPISAFFPLKPEKYLDSIRKKISNGGIFVLGLGNSRLSEKGAVDILRPHFQDIVTCRNRYITDKSFNPIDYLITAKPKA